MVAYYDDNPTFIRRSLMWQKWYTVQYQYDTTQHNTIQHNTIQYNAVQYNAIQYNTNKYEFCKAKATYDERLD